MEIYNAYEVLDKLAEKSKMFEMIRDDNKHKDAMIAELKTENEMLQSAIAELSMLIGGMY